MNRIEDVNNRIMVANRVLFPNSKLITKFAYTTKLKLYKINTTLDIFG